ANRRPLPTPMSVLDPAPGPQLVQEVRDPEVAAADGEGDRHRLRPRCWDRRRRRDAVEPDTRLAGCARELPKDVGHLGVVREGTAQLGELTGALASSRTAQ